MKASHSTPKNLGMAAMVQRDLKQLSLWDGNEKQVMKDPAVSEVVKKTKHTSLKTNMTDWKIHHEGVDVSPIKNCDFPGSHVSSVPGVVVLQKCPPADGKFMMGKNTKNIHVLKMHDSQATIFGSRCFNK